MHSIIVRHSKTFYKNTSRMKLTSHYMIDADISLFSSSFFLPLPSHQTSHYVVLVVAFFFQFPPPADGGRREE